MKAWQARLSGLLPALWPVVFRLRGLFWGPPMAKNIVICCDGTACEFGDRNSNVVKLYALLTKSPAQSTYYHPGLGTMGSRLALTKFTRWWTRLLGLAFGYGLMSNISDAYGFLMDEYDEGDFVFLFGFSRGAYTVRALAALLHMFGLIRRGNLALVPYILKTFRAKIRNRHVFEIADGFKQTYSSECRPHFLGAWDTVSSVGWIYDPLHLPYTVRNPDVKICRHAISIDERRCAFRQNLWEAQNGQDSKQVWFAGTHSDMDGGYPSGETGLSDLALSWMLREARTAGLRLDDSSALFTMAPDPCGPLHDSMTLAWMPLEVVPRRYVDVGFTPPRVSWCLPWAHRRTIAEDSVLHRSVEARKKALGYAPPNLPRSYRTET